MAASQQKIEELLNGPALKPPPGVTPNFSANSHQHILVISVGATSIFVAGVFVILRYYAKYLARRRLEATDLFLLLGYFGTVSMFGPGVMIWKNGIGIHRWNLRLRTFFRMLYWTNIHNIMYGPTIFCIKTAIMLQYINIFAPQRSMDKFMFYGGWTAIFANLVFYLVRTIVNIVYCIPREKIWNKLLPGGHCISNDGFMTTTGLVNAISDIVILLLPIRSLWKLKIATKKKVHISMLFATGLLACAASSVRFSYDLKAVIGHQASLRDVSYDLTWEGIWAYVEMNLGTIIACSISIPKLFKESKVITSTLSHISSVFSQRINRRPASKGSDEIELSQKGLEPPTAIHETTMIQVDRSFDIESRRGAAINKWN